MIGTIVNVTTIVAGSSIGTLLGKGIKESYQKIVYQGLGLVALSLGMTWIVKNLGSSNEPLLFIGSMVLGGILGQFINLEDRVKKLQDRFKSDGEHQLMDGLVTAILLFCVGTMSILGPLESALNNNHTLLYTNAMLDGITSLILASSFGIGIMLSAGILFLWQGTIYMSASYIAPFMTPELMGQISIIGGILILSSGLNILNITKIKTLNLLPALFMPAIYFLIKQLWL